MHESMNSNILNIFRFLQITPPAKTRPTNSPTASNVMEINLDEAAAPQPVDKNSILDLNTQFSPNADKKRLNKNDYLKFLIGQLANDQGEDNAKIYNDCLVPHSIFRIGKKPSRPEKPPAANVEDITA